MKKNSINKAILVSVAILSCNTIQCAEKADEVKKEIIVTELNDGQKKLLNMYLESQPDLLFKVTLTVLEAEKVLTKLKSTNEEDLNTVVKKNKQTMIKLANKLLEPFYCFGSKAIEGILNPKDDPAIKTADFMVVQFFNEKEYNEFFNKKINNKESLVQACTEFVTFSKIIFSCASENAIKASWNYIENNKKLPAAMKTSVQKYLNKFLSEEILKQLQSKK